MSNLDDRIKDALRGEDLAAWEKSGQLSFLQEAIQTLTSRHRWINVLAIVYTLAFMVIAVFCVVRFFQATEIKTLLAWGGGVFLSVLFVAMLKLWFWMEMQKNEVLREVKRLELQVARFVAGRG